MKFSSVKLLWQFVHKDIEEVVGVFYENNPGKEPLMEEFCQKSTLRYGMFGLLFF
jgi:hypothetical protein